MEMDDDRTQAVIPARFDSTHPSTSLGTLSPSKGRPESVGRRIEGQAGIHGSLGKFRQGAFWLVFLVALAGMLLARPQKNPESGWKERDAWQEPERVMDALDLGPGSAVADAGCGRGYFTARLAERVGEQGKVYAEDVQDDVLKAVADYAREKKLTQVVTVQGTEDDPSLPPGSLDAILIVNAYHEMKHYQAMLAGFAKALKPGGLLAIVDHQDAAGKPRGDYEQEHRISLELVREECTHNGFEFVREDKGFDRPAGDGGGHFFFLIFRKPH
jgi:predicted methyltransferase